MSSCTIAPWRNLPVINGVLPSVTEAPCCRRRWYMSIWWKISGNAARCSFCRSAFADDFWRNLVWHHICGWNTRKPHVFILGLNDITPFLQPSLASSPQVPPATLAVPVCALRVSEEQLSRPSEAQAALDREIATANTTVEAYFLIMSIKEMKMVSGYFLLLACGNLMKYDKFNLFQVDGRSGASFAYQSLKSFPRWWQETAEDEIIEPPLIYTADSKGPLVTGLLNELGRVGTGLGTRLGSLYSVTWVLLKVNLQLYLVYPKQRVD